MLGAVKINTGARFEHVAAVWSGPCDNMEIVGCLENPLPCEGFVTIGELIPGQTYRLQIAS